MSPHSNKNVKIPITSKCLKGNFGAFFETNSVNRHTKCRKDVNPCTAG